MDSPNINSGVLDEFRRLIGDTSYTHVQLELSCDAEDATIALVEVTDNRLITSITTGATAELDLDLLDSTLDSIEKLVNHIRGITGYTARVLQDGDGSHASADLEIIF